MGAPAMAGPPPQGYGYYGQPYYPNTHFTQQPSFGYGGSPPGFPTQPYTGHSPVSFPTTTIKNEHGPGINGKSTMPAAAPGLPQRPSFDAPSFSKEAMLRFHYGQAAPQSQPASGVPEESGNAHQKVEPSAAGPSDEEETLYFRQPGVRPPTEQEVDELIEWGRSTAEAANRAADAADAAAAAEKAVNSEETSAVGKVAAEDKATAIDNATVVNKAPKSASKRKDEKVKSVYKVRDNFLSAEEKKAQQPKYAQRAHKMRREAEKKVVDQADSQAVTGRVADDLEL